MTFLARDPASTITNIAVRDLQTGKLSVLLPPDPNYRYNYAKLTSPVISGNGRFVLFTTTGINLLADDRNNVADLFVHDRQLNATLLVSKSLYGGTGNGRTSNPVMAADGRTVVFHSFADDLTPGDYNGARDVMVLKLGGTDSDADGLDDDWELAYFNTLSRDGTGDFDGDGQSDAQEFRAGTDPTNAGSILRVLTVSAPGSGATTVLWAAIPGHTYRVQYKESVTSPTWTDLAGDVTAASTTGSKTDPGAGPQAQRYYRVTLVP